MTNTKVDFWQILQRRRFTVERWLESERITTVAQFDQWCSDHAHEYVFTEKFLRDSKVSLFETMGDLPSMSLKEIEAAVEVTRKQKDEEVRNGFVELPAEEPKKKNKKESVNIPPKED